MSSYWGIYKVRIPFEDLRNSAPEFESSQQKIFIEKVEKTQKIQKNDKKLSFF